MELNDNKRFGKSFEIMTQLVWSLKNEQIVYVSTHNRDYADRLIWQINRVISNTFTLDIEFVYKPSLPSGELTLDGMRLKRKKI